MLALRLGWRNLWRNPRRSLITVSSLATAFVFMTLMLGMLGGLRQQLLQNGTGLMLGHLQLHHVEYLPQRNLFDTLGADLESESDALRSRLLDVPEVKAASPRVYGFALLSTGRKSAGAQLLGIEPAQEKSVTTFLNSMRPQDESLRLGSNRIWLGAQLAKEIGAEIGTEVAAVTQASDGSLGNELFWVNGILRTGMTRLDRSLALVQFQDLQQLLALEEGRFHEMAVKLTDPMKADLLAAQLADRLPRQVKVSSWGELAPQLKDYVHLSESAYGIFIGLVGIFAALGILNTMMMSVFERTRELGVMSSLGMSPWQILFSVLAESLCLAVAGLALGLLISGLAMQYLTVEGLDLSRWMGELTMMNTHIDPILRFEWSWREVAFSALGLVLACVIGGILPARRAARLDPVEALATPVEA